VLKIESRLELKDQNQDKYHLSLFMLNSKWNNFLTRIIVTFMMIIIYRAVIVFKKFENFDILIT
jgi:hypothetical protein